MIRLAKLVGKGLPEGSFKAMLERLYDKHITFAAMWSSVGKIVKWKRFEDGILRIGLNNGLEYCAPLSPDTKLGSRYMVFREAYGRLMEQFIRGIYEKDCQLQKGDIVIDAGASWGFNTVDFSRKVGNEGIVVAIEPDKDSLVYLERNIELNGCKNVTVVKKGLWSKKGKLKFYLNENMGTNSAIIPGKKVTGTTEIEVDTLDNILDELGIDIGKVVLMKMDIEGAEIEALKGMDRIVSKNNDVKVAVASYHIVDGQPTHKTIIPMMEQMGFSSQFKDGISYFAKR